MAKGIDEVIKEMFGRVAQIYQQQNAPITDAPSQFAQTPALNPAQPMPMQNLGFQAFGPYAQLAQRMAAMSPASSAFNMPQAIQPQPVQMAPRRPPIGFEQLSSPMSLGRFNAGLL